MLDIGQVEPTAMLEQAASDFVDWRPRLFGVAYRILGSASEAEGIVQEVWLRCQTTDRTVVKDPPAFLAKTATRLAINVAQSARSRRQAYVGPSLAEPVDTSADPELGAERGEALELAVLLLLEKLTPTERAAFVPREAFDYSYEQIAPILRLGEANTRQLVSRARKHLTSERHGPVTAWELRRLLEAFLGASQKGDLVALIAESELDEVTGSIVVVDDQQVVGLRRAQGCTISATANRPRRPVWLVAGIPGWLGTSSTGTGLCSSTSVATRPKGSWLRVFRPRVVMAMMSMTDRWARLSSTRATESGLLMISVCVTTPSARRMAAISCR
jgi:RNA polymerase sigma factor (sigma-70 family)